MGNLIGESPPVLLQHGPSKILIDEFIWHDPEFGIVTGYTPAAKDVLDHFGLFRGVDQIESMAQAMAACSAYLECSKKNKTYAQFRTEFNPLFLSVGQINFHSYLQEGEMFICLGNIKFYKFRQMISDGRIYKVPANMNVNDYFKDFTTSRLMQYDLPDEFKLVAEIHDLIGRALKKQ